MSLLNVITNVAKAGLAIAATPAAVVVDTLTLPASALEDRHPFGCTKKMIDAVGECVSEAVKATTDDK